MRTPRDQPVMLSGIQSDLPRAEPGDAVAKQTRHRVIRLTGQNPRPPPEQISVGDFSPAGLLARHWMPPEKSATSEILRGGFADGAFGAPGVRDKRVGVHHRFQTSQRFNDAGNGLREKEQIRPLSGFFERHATINRAARKAGFETVPGTDARDLAWDSGLAQGQTE